MRVATFNIRHGRGMDDVVDLRRTAQAIVDANADVIGLQEVDRLTTRTGEMDQPTVLRELTGLSIGFWPTLGWDSGEFGLALAARGDVDARFEPLDNLGVGRPHGVVVAAVSGFTILVTHLSRHPVARDAESGQLLALARGLEGPVVIAGDLNQGPRRLRRFRAVGFTADRRPRFTHPSRLPLRQIDHVLAGPGLRVQRSWTVRTLASDHLPLVAEIDRG